jgi:hypothetical protein
MTPTKKTFEFRRGTARFVRKSTTVTFMSVEYDLTLVRIHPSAEHASRTTLPSEGSVSSSSLPAAGGPDAASGLREGTLRWDKDES